MTFLKIPSFNMNKILPPKGEIDRIDGQAALEREQEKIGKLCSIEKTVAGINSELQNESEERRRADVENMRYSKKWNRISLLVGVIAILIALASLVVSILK